MNIVKFLSRPGNYLFPVYLLRTVVAFSQPVTPTETKIEYNKIYAYALDGNIRPALKLVDMDSSVLSQQDRKFKKAFESRFKLATDESHYPEKVSPVDDMVKIYKDYWRMSLLDTASNFDMILGRNLIGYLVSHYPPAKIITTTSNRDTIGIYLSRFLTAYLNSLHLYTTGFGRTGKLIDLLIWKTQKDTLYNFSLANDNTSAPVTMMDDFVTLGWEEYASLGRHYPGGWTTKESLFCVTKAYDLSSEAFLISYLAHESRHFADYQLFPKLKTADLEYRAKLTELSMARFSLYDLIQFFINNANNESLNPHSVANYCVIHDLSKALFKKDFESNIDKWKQVPVKKLNKKALKILQHNTKLLQKSREDAISVIKP